MKKYLPFALLCLLSASVYADINTAFNDGKSFSSTANGSMAGLITDSSASSVLPAVNTNPKEAAYYMDGNGMVATNGSARVTECATATQTTNQDKVECDAVNYLAGYRPKEFNLDPTRDPLVTNAKQYTNQSTSPTPQVCKKQTVTTPATYEEKSCSEHPTSSTHTCHQNLVVVPSSVSTPPVSVNFAGQTDNGETLDHAYSPIDANNFTLNVESWIGRPGYGGIRDAIATFYFDIDNPSQLKAFKAIAYQSPNNVFGWNVYAKVNGTTVLVYPRQRIGWTTVDIDLRPYLVPGRNVIQLLQQYRLANGGNHYLGVYTSWLKVFFDNSSTNTYTETTSWTDDCGELAKTCSLTSSQVCTAYTSDPINGGQRCSQYESTYSCNDGLKGDCQVLRDQGCEQIGNSCFNQNPDGSCAVYDNTFRCQTSPASTKDTFICVDEQFCDGGLCFNSADEPNDGFTTAVAMMEAAREAGMYPGGTNGTIELFKGEQQECTKKVVGSHTILSCCQTVSKPPITNSVTTPTYTTAQSPTPDKTTTNTTQGSAYQYDDVYNDDIMIQQLQSALTGGWLQCTDAEKKLGIIRGQNLCVQSNERCTNKTFLGICLERTAYFCCFKSLLAKAFNRGGRTQLGLPLTQCGGFSIDQLKQIDFSQIDLSEFMSSIVPPTVNVDGITNNVKQKVESTSGYYE